MTKNFKYDLWKSSLILTEEEHIAVQKIVDNGGGMVKIRNGSIGFDTATIKFFNETNESPNIETLSLPDAGRIALKDLDKKRKEKIKQKFKEMREYLNEKHGWWKNEIKK